MASNDFEALSLIYSKLKKQYLSRTTCYRIWKESKRESKYVSSNFDNSTHQEATECAKNTLQDYYGPHLGSIASHSGLRNISFHVPLENHQSCTIAPDEAEVNYREPDYHYVSSSNETESDDTDYINDADEID